MEFYHRKIITEEAKPPPRILVNKLSTNAVTNGQQIMPKLLPNIKDVRSRLPTVSTEEQDSSQSINSTFPNATIPKKKKYFTFLG